MNRSIAIIFAVECSFALQTTRQGIMHNINITKDKEIACKPFKSYLMGAIIGCSNIRRIAETYKRLQCVFLHI